MLKVKNLIKVLLLSYIIYTNAKAYKEPRQTSKTEISAKTAKDLQSLFVFAKTPSQKSGRAPNTCHKIVVRKVPIFKLKQKRVKIFKN